MVSTHRYLSLISDPSCCGILSNWSLLQKRRITSLCLCLRFCLCFCRPRSRMGTMLHSVGLLHCAFVFVCVCISLFSSLFLSPSRPPLSQYIFRYISLFLISSFLPSFSVFLSVCFCAWLSLYLSCSSVSRSPACLSLFGRCNRSPDIAHVPTRTHL